MMFPSKAHGLDCEGYMPMGMINIIKSSPKGSLASQGYADSQIKGPQVLERSSKRLK